MGRRGAAALGIGALAMAAAPPAAASDTLTGDWGGLRTRLADRGLEFYATYASGLWSNLRGGRATGVRYEGFAEWGLDADLETLWGWPGARFHAGMQSYHGGQPSEDLVGTLGSTSPSYLEAETHYRFYEIFLEQSFADDRVTLKLGQLAADEDFYAQNRENDLLLNASYTFLVVGRDRQVAPFYPLPGPGAVLTWEPDDVWELRLGAYVAEVGDDEESNIGFDWSFSEGAVLISELAAKPAPRGLAGRYALGLIYGTPDTTDLGGSPGGEVNGTWALYATVNQVLWVRDGRPLLGGFLAVQHVPQVDRAAVRWAADAGFKLRNPWTVRPEDFVSVGVSFVRMGREFRSFSAATGRLEKTQWNVELSYFARLAPWLEVQPSLQLFLDPILEGDDAVVLGVQVEITL